MAEKFLDTSLLDRALNFAIAAHSGCERRGKGFPYIVHPLEAVSIVATMTSDQELLAAAALHDTIEDTDVTYSDIEKEFGARVASLVQMESDDNDLSDWRERKTRSINRLSGATLEEKMVAIGDKLSNMRAIARDYEIQGDELWKIFHAPGGKADHEWHYRFLCSALKDLDGTAPYREFVCLIEKVFA